MLWVLEDASRYLRVHNTATGNNVESWIVVVDFIGYTLKDFQPAILQSTKQVWNM